MKLNWQEKRRRQGKRYQIEQRFETICRTARSYRNRTKTGWAEQAAKAFVLELLGFRKYIRNWRPERLHEL